MKREILWNLQGIEKLCVFVFLVFQMKPLQIFKYVIQVCQDDFGSVLRIYYSIRLLKNRICLWSSVLHKRKGLRRVLCILALCFFYPLYRQREIFCFRAFICRFTDSGKCFGKTIWKIWILLYDYYITWKAAWCQEGVLKPFRDTWL